jgi:hypothetical protein
LSHRPRGVIFVEALPFLGYRDAVKHRSPGSAGHRGAAVVGRATLGIQSIQSSEP